MISEQGVIEKITGQKAVVRVKKSSACAQCGSRESCGISDRDMRVEVQNSLDAIEGDLVEISVHQGALLKISFLVYLLPVLAFILGAFTGLYLSTVFNTDQSKTAIATGAIFLAVSFLGLKVYERSGSRNADYLPRMTRIINNSSKPCDSK